MLLLAKMAVVPLEPLFKGVEVIIVTCGAVVCSADLRTQQPVPRVYYESKSMQETTQCIASFIIMHYVSVPKKELY